MPLPMTATDAIDSWLADNRDQHVDLIIAGRIFGGRHGGCQQHDAEDQGTNHEGRRAKPRLTVSGSGTRLL